MLNFVVSSKPTDGLVPSSTRASAATMMTQFESHIHDKSCITMWSLYMEICNCLKSPHHKTMFYLLCLLLCRLYDLQWWVDWPFTVLQGQVHCIGNKTSLEVLHSFKTAFTSVFCGQHSKVQAKLTPKHAVILWFLVLRLSDIGIKGLGHNSSKAMACCLFGAKPSKVRLTYFESYPLQLT